MKVVVFPGQGSQYKGMGKDLFKLYPAETGRASALLGYDIEELCVSDPARQLGKTQYTQPALYVVNALAWYSRQEPRPAYLAGHSLGEYNALLAAGAFDFETGLRLVQKRGALMSAASGGAMAAVLGLSATAVRRKLDEGGYADIDVANYNTPTQTVVAGTQDGIIRLVKELDAQGIRVVPLNVSAPFHSRYMQAAAEEFAAFLRSFSFSRLGIPVISNVTARPYGNDVADLLSRQIASPVQWTDTVRYLMGKGVSDFDEIGGSLLSKMVAEIRNDSTPVFDEEKAEAAEYAPQQPAPATRAGRIGSSSFKSAYGIRYAYVAGSMYKGIASKEMVIRMGRAGLLGFFGTGGLSFAEIEASIDSVQAALTQGEPYGFNLLHQFANPQREMKTVELYLRKGITRVEASAYIQITPALVYYRVKGLSKGADGSILCKHQVIAKVSRPEVAEAFLRPPPMKIVNQLLEEGLITAEQAALSQQTPMSHDICVEADSGGHTDRGVALVLLPAIQQLRIRIAKEQGYDRPIHVGLAGGIGTPQAVACTFMMGADFVLTGSINQCTVEAGASNVVKDILQEINVQDTDYAPAGDMFEIGSKVQVLKKSVLFPARANKLFTLYNQYDSLEDIPGKVIRQIEDNYFRRPLSTVWEDTKVHLRNRGAEATITTAEANAKQKMALVFKWYFHYSNRLALEGDTDDRVNFQVHTGPALGSFNQWVKGTELESWRNRHVDAIGILLMEEAALLFEKTFQTIVN